MFLLFTELCIIYDIDIYVLIYGKIATVVDV